MPNWALTLAFWLHMAATVVWIGGLFFQSVVLTPALLQGLPMKDLAGVLSALRRRFEPLAWLSLAVLIGTGLVQMTASEQYTGLLSVSNRWSAALLAKHIAIAFMVLAASYQTWFLQPRLERAVLAQVNAPYGDATPLLSLQGKLTRLNLGLGILVLALTAVARTA